MKFFEYIECNNPQVRDLLTHTGRYTCRSFFKVQVRDGQRYCAWCNQVGIRLPYKYCSEDCIRSTEAFCYPQGEDACWLLLDRQQYKCAMCGFDYTPYAPKDAKTAYTFIKFTRRNLVKAEMYRERNLEVDHVIPICQGGISLGLENHQVLCSKCHMLKSVSDRKLFAY